MMDASGYTSKNIDDQGMPKGSPRQLNAIGGLGMVLMWYCTRGSCNRNLALLLVKHVRLCTND